MWEVAEWVVQSGWVHAGAIGAGVVKIVKNETENSSDNHMQGTASKGIQMEEMEEFCSKLRDNQLV